MIIDNIKIIVQSLQICIHFIVVYRLLKVRKIKINTNYVLYKKNQIWKKHTQRASWISVFIEVFHDISILYTTKSLNKCSSKSSTNKIAISIMTETIRNISMKQTIGDEKLLRFLS